MADDLLRLPWRLAPLDGKYYGTKVLNADGDEVLSVGHQEFGLEPSERERPVDKEHDWPCDDHYESVGALTVASAIVAKING